MTSKFKLTSHIMIHQPREVMMQFLLQFYSSVGSMEGSQSPGREDSGCGAGIFHLSSSGPGSPETSSIPNNEGGQQHFDKTVRLLVGSKHHFDLVKINLGVTGSSDTMKILTLASGSSFGAISATEVSLFLLKVFKENYD